MMKTAIKRIKDNYEDWSETHALGIIRGVLFLLSVILILGCILLFESPGIEKVWLNIRMGLLQWSFISRMELLVTSEFIGTCLTMFGLSNTTLSAINASREKRVSGIPVFNIIDFFYPKRRWIYAFQFVFYVLGLLSVNDVHRRSSLFFLAGSVLCFAYLLRFARKIVYSEEMRNRLTHKYLLLSVKKEEFRKVFDQTRYIYSKARSVASYISSKEDWYEDYHLGKYGDVYQPIGIRFLIKDLLELESKTDLKADSILGCAFFDRICQSLFEKEKCLGASWKSDMDVTGLLSESGRIDLVAVALLCHCPETGIPRERFIHNLLGCNDVWKCLLDPFNTENEKIRMIQLVFLEIQGLKGFNTMTAIFLCSFLIWSSRTTDESVSGDILWERFERIVNEQVVLPVEYQTDWKTFLRSFRILHTELALIWLCMDLIEKLIFHGSGCLSRKSQNKAIQLINWQLAEETADEKYVKTAVIYAGLILMAIYSPDSGGFDNDNPFGKKTMVAVIRNVPDIVTNLLSSERSSNGYESEV